MLVKVAISSSLGALAPPAARPAISLTHSPIAALAALAPLGGVVSVSTAVSRTVPVGRSVAGEAAAAAVRRGVAVLAPIRPAKILLSVARCTLASRVASLICPGNTRWERLGGALFEIG